MHVTCTVLLHVFQTIFETHCPLQHETPYETSTKSLTVSKLNCLHDHAEKHGQWCCDVVHTGENHLEALRLLQQKCWQILKWSPQAHIKFQWIDVVTLWSLNITMGKSPFKVDLPIRHGDFL